MRRRAGAFAATIALTACGTGPLRAPQPPDGVSVGGAASVSMPRPASLDPGNVLDRTGEVVVRTMCDSLLDVDRVTGEIVPALVESWVVTDDGNRIVLRLRKGLTFWDGTAVTARDAAFALARSASADFAGENADQLSGVQGWAVLRGLEEADEPRHRRELSGVRVVSELAFEVSLDGGAQVVLPVLTSPLASPLSRAAAEADPQAFASMPVCVGPYRPTAPFDADAATMTLERVDSYAGVNEAFTGGGQGWLERITFRWTDGAAVPDDSRADVAEVARRPGTGNVVSTASPWVQYVGVPSALLPAEGRRALSQALDRRRIADVALAGRALPATSFLPPSLGSRLHDPGACGDRVPADGDVALARRTLAAAGLDLRGFRLRLATNPDFDNVTLVAAVAEQWRAAFPGFDVTVSSQPWDEYRQAFESPDGFATGFRTSNHVPYAGADAWLRPFWTGSIAQSNAVGYSSGVLDRLLEVESRAATDQVDQAVLHREAQAILCEDLPLIPVVMDQRHFLVAPELTSATGDLGDLADPVTGGLRLRDLHRP